MSDVSQGSMFKMTCASHSLRRAMYQVNSTCGFRHNNIREFKKLHEEAPELKPSEQEESQAQFSSFRTIQLEVRELTKRHADNVPPLLHCDGAHRSWPSLTLLALRSAQVPCHLRCRCHQPPSSSPFLRVAVAPPLSLGTQRCEKG